MMNYKIFEYDIKTEHGQNDFSLPIHLISVDVIFLNVILAVMHKNSYARRTHASIKIIVALHTEISNILFLLIRFGKHTNIFSYWQVNKH